MVCNVWVDFSIPLYTCLSGTSPFFPHPWFYHLQIMFVWSRSRWYSWCSPDASAARWVNLKVHWFPKTVHTSIPASFLQISDICEPLGCILVRLQAFNWSISSCLSTPWRWASLGFTLVLGSASLTGATSCRERAWLAPAARGWEHRGGGDLGYTVDNPKWKWMIGHTAWYGMKWHEIWRCAEVWEKVNNIKHHKHLQFFPWMLLAPPVYNM